MPGLIGDYNELQMEEKQHHSFELVVTDNKHNKRFIKLIFEGGISINQL